jgi:uncharacterized membrane protein YfcA
MHDFASIFVVTAIAFLLAGFVKGMIGMGLPTVAIGLLSVVMLPSQAAALLVFPTLVTNIWQLATGSNLIPLMRRLRVMLATSALVTFVASGLLTGTSGRAVVALGVALICYAILGLAKVRISTPAWTEPWLSPVIGATTGLVAGATGVMALPAVAYFQAIGLNKEDMIQALGLSFTASMLALAAGLAREGAFHGAMAGASLLALAPASAGMLVGQWLRLRVRPDVFRLCFFLGLLGLGAHLLLRTLI